jgi:hypothetical protein
MSASPTVTPTPNKKDLRRRTQYFPNGDKLIFDKSKKGYVPLPILMRKAMRYVTPPELRVLVYLQTRCGPEMICYPAIEEIAHDLGLTGTKNVTPHIRGLEKKKFISTMTRAGKKYFLVHDPAVAIEYLVKDGQIPAEDLEDINELLAILKRDPIAQP